MLAAALAILMSSPSRARADAPITLDTVDALGVHLDAGSAYNAAAWVATPLSFAAGSTITVVARWGGLTNTSVNVAPAQDETLWIDARTGAQSTTASVGVSQVLVVFEPLQVTQDCVDQQGAHLAGSRAHNGQSWSDTPWMTTVARGGTRSHLCQWGALTSQANNVTFLLNETSSIDALSNARTTFVSTGTHVEFRYSVIEVTQDCVDQAGTHLPGGRAHNGNAWVPTPWVRQMAVGGTPGVYGDWGGLGNGWHTITLAAGKTDSIDALTGVVTRTDSAETRINFHFIPVDVVTACVDLASNHLVGALAYAGGTFVQAPYSRTGALGGTHYHACAYSGVNSTAYYNVALASQMASYDVFTQALTIVSATSSGTRFVYPIPTADAGAEQEVMTGSTVDLNGSASFDPRGLPLGFQWTLVKPAGSDASLANATTAFPSFDVDVAGDYIATLVVSDINFVSGPDSVIVTAVDPIACSHEACAEQSGCVYLAQCDESAWIFYVPVRHKVTGLEQSLRCVATPGAAPSCTVMAVANQCEVAQ